MRQRPPGFTKALAFSQRSAPLSHRVGLSVLLSVFAAITPLTAASAGNLLLLAGAFVGPDVVVVGERATILRSRDNASTWERAAVAVPSGPAPTLTGITFAPDSQSGWAVGHDALILSTNDGGRSWKKAWQGENLTDSFLDVLALDARHIVAVGAYGLYLESNDSGLSWNRRKLLSADQHLNRLTRGPRGTLYLAGERGTLLRSRTAGADWTLLSSPYEGSFFGVLPLDPPTLLAYGLRGRIYRSTDDGDSWTKIETGFSGLVATGLSLKSGTLVFAGQARTLEFSRDLGRTVSSAQADSLTAISSLLELPDGRILALGEAGATLLAAP